MKLALATVTCLLTASALAGAPPPARDWRTLPATTDREALAVWLAMQPHAGTWADLRDTIPDALRKPLARALLAGGHLHCATRRKPPPTCAHPALMPAPPKSAGFDEPCFRHVLATWAVDQLDGHELAALEPTVLPLVKLAPPEDEPAKIVLQKIGEDDPQHLLPFAIAAAKAGISSFDIPVEKMSDADQAVARAQGHVYIPMDHYDGHIDMPVLLQAAADPKLAPQQRETASFLLASQTSPGDPLPADVHAVLVAATRDPSCSLAMYAASLLSEHGEPEHLPGRPLSRSTAATMRALCMAFSSTPSLDTTASESTGDLRDGLHPPKTKLVFVRKTVDVELGTSSSETITFDRSSPFWPDSDEALALQSCTGTTCRYGELELRLRFVPAPDGGLYLTRIDETIHAGACHWFEMTADPG